MSTAEPVSNLESLKSLVETNLPAVISAAGLTALEEFVLGGPTAAEKLSLGFYMGPGDDDPEMQNFKPVLHLQLYGVSYTESLSYFKEIYEYLRGVDPRAINMTAETRRSYDEFPADQFNGVIFLIYLEYMRELDDLEQ